MSAAGGIRTEEAADYQDPEVVGDDQQDSGESGDEHVDHGPRSRRDASTGEHDDDGDNKSASEAEAEDDADLAVGEADFGEVYDR